MICCCHHPGNLLSSVPAEFATCFFAASSLWVFNLPFVLIHLLSMVWEPVAHPIIVSACWLPGCGAGLRSYGNIPLLAGCSVALLACPTRSSLASCQRLMVEAVGYWGWLRCFLKRLFSSLFQKGCKQTRLYCALCFLFLSSPVWAELGISSHIWKNSPWNK